MSNVWWAETDREAFRARLESMLDDVPGISFRDSEKISIAMMSVLDAMIAIVRKTKGESH